MSLAGMLAGMSMENVNARTNPARAEVRDIEEIFRRSFDISVSG